jgi:hypothetical protein
VIREACVKEGTNEQGLRGGGQRKTVSQVRARISYISRPEWGIPMAEITPNFFATFRLPAKDCECQVIHSQADRPTDYDRRGFFIKSRNRVPTMNTAPPSQKARM